MNEPFIRQRGAQLFTTSIDVAEKFGKRHDRVLRSIRNIIAETLPSDAPKNGGVSKVPALKIGGVDFGKQNFRAPTYSTSFSRAQEARDHSEHPDYWLPPEPPTWGDEQWEEQFCDKIAENFIKDKGTLPEFKANIGNIAQHIAEQREGVIEGYPWEYLAEAWLDADGWADDFLRLHGEIAGWIVSWGGGDVCPDFKNWRVEIMEKLSAIWRQLGGEP